MESGLRILIRSPQVPFLVPPKTSFLAALLCKERYFAKSRISVKDSFPDPFISHSIFTSLANQRMYLCRASIQRNSPKLGDNYSPALIFGV